jgi:hypothetical protein
MAVSVVSMFTLIIVSEAVRLVKASGVCWSTGVVSVFSFLQDTTIIAEMRNNSKAIFFITSGILIK